MRFETKMYQQQHKLIAWDDQNVMYDGRWTDMTYPALVHVKGVTYGIFGSYWSGTAPVGYVFVFTSQEAHEV